MNGSSYNIVEYWEADRIEEKGKEDGRGVGKAGEVSEWMLSIPLVRYAPHDCRLCS
jgi:hypothetical protein